MKLPYVDRIGKPAPYKLPRKMKKACKRKLMESWMVPTFPARFKRETTIHWVPCQGWTVTYIPWRHAVAK